METFFEKTLDGGGNWSVDAAPDRGQANPHEGQTQSAGIEFEIVPIVQRHFFELAPSTETAEGAFAFRKQKSPSRYRIVL